MRPNTKASLPMTLKLNGYSTAQFGKCHEVPPWQTSPVGPFDAWPTGGGGFEHFYGFIGGKNNQCYPALYEGISPVEAEKTPEDGYHLTEDLADRAIDWIRTQKALAPDKPFFAYFAPGATHAPHHVPPEWADKYAGKFAATATEAVTPGKHQIRSEFGYARGGLAKGGTDTVYYDGREVGQGWVDQTQPVIFSADETTDIGEDYGMPASVAYADASRFNGHIDVVQIDVGDDDHSHLIDPADIARVAVSRQ